MKYREENTIKDLIKLNKKELKEIKKSLKKIGYDYLTKKSD